MSSINLLDLRWFESQVMSDVPDGGGLITGREIPEGDVSGIFPNISSQQLVTGGVNLRLVYAGLFSNDTNTLFGSGVVIIEPPEHPAVNMLLFDARPGEVRAEAERRIESYLIPGVTTTWRLLQDHPQGQSVLTLWALPDTPGFQVGDTLVLEHVAGTEPVRIERINARTTTRFSDSRGIFDLDLLELILTRGIEQDLPGESASRLTANTPATAVKRTTVSDGAHYYGIAPITAPITAGDLNVHVESLVSPVVPATTAETPIIDSRAALSRVVLVATGAVQGTVVDVPTVSVAANEARSIYFGGPFLPGSLVIAGSITATDDGKGQLSIEQSGIVGRCDYETGEIVITPSATHGLGVTLTATPAAPVVQSNQTGRVLVTPQSRASTYVLSMIPAPAPGSVTVDYRALSRWYRLEDQGNGTIRGQLPGEGSGSVNFATGSAAVNLSQLPDVGSEIIYSWGTGVSVEDGRDEISPDAPEVRGTLNQTGIDSGSVEVTYQSGGLTITITDDGAGNLLEDGQSVGTIIYSSGDWVFRPSSWPNPDTVITIDYVSAGAREFASFQPTVGSGQSGPVALNLGQGVKPNSVRLQWLVENEQNGRFFQDEVAIVDDGAGGFVWDTDGALNGQPVPAGVIDYASGDCSFPTTAQINIQVPATVEVGGVDENGNDITVQQVVGFVTEQHNWAFSTGGTITARFTAANTNGENHSDGIPVPEIQIDLTPDSTRSVVPGSVRFALNNRVYVDREGSLVHSVDPRTNAGTAGGSINYSTGTVTITDWQQGNQEIQLQSLGLSSGQTPVTSMSFRTDSAPNKQGSLSLRATVLDTGELLQGSADISGNITGDQMAGTFDAELGIVSVRFGRYVMAEGNEGEWWYSADQVRPDGTIWRPVFVVPGSVFFNAVAFSTIPVPSFILGLDPILLPQSGLVPIFAPGDIAMIHRLDTQVDEAPAAGALVPIDLPALKWVRVRDANGAPVASDQYHIDDVAIGLRWANPLDLSQYMPPFTIQAFWYVQALINEAQINGQISLSMPMPFDLPGDGKTYISSVLPFNPKDQSARATNIFTQQTWTGEFFSQPDGSVTAGQFDDVNFPPVVTNLGTITERWRIQFTNSNTVNVIGEQTGQVLTGASITDNIAPINPAHGVPYFVLPAGGFSQGFVTGNVLRMDTIGAHSGVWMLRSVQPSSQEVGNDGALVSLIGDGDPL